MVTALLYAPVMSQGFVYEDEHWLPLVTEARAVRVPGRELSWLTHHLTWRITGFEPALYHAVNVGVHLINGLLVYAVAASLVPSAALWAAGVFLLHPLNSEAVMYLTARTDLLMTMGVLVAVWCSLGPVVWWRWLLVGVGVLIAASSKEVGVIGVALVALTVAHGGRWPSAQTIAGSYALTAMLSVAAIGSGLALGHGWPAAMNWLTAVPRVGGPTLPWMESLSLQASALWHLLALVVWPVGFSIDHDVLTISHAGRLLAALVTVQAVALIGLCWRRWPLVAWALAWVALSVGPRFVFRTSEFITEPQMYLPMVGVSVLAGTALGRLWAWRPATLSERTA